MCLKMLLFVSVFCEEAPQSTNHKDMWLNEMQGTVGTTMFIAWKQLYVVGVKERLSRGIPLNKK